MSASAISPQPRRLPAPDDLLTVAEAATIARRSVRTIRRAYSKGALRAYRDGNGRGVRIQYADLRDWLTAMSAVIRRDDLERPAGRPTRRARASRERLDENLRLLGAAQARPRPAQRR